MTILQEIKKLIESDKNIYKNRYWYLEYKNISEKEKLTIFAHKISTSHVIFMGDYLNKAPEHNSYLLNLYKKYPLKVIISDIAVSIEYDINKLRKLKIDNLLNI